MTEIHNKIHHKILSSLPDELIGLIIEFHPYVEPVSHFDKFKLDIKYKFYQRIKSTEFRKNNYYFYMVMSDIAVELMDSYKLDNDAIEKIFDNDFNVLLQMNSVIEKCDDDGFQEECYVNREFSMNQTIRNFIYSYAYIIKPTTYQEYIDITTYEIPKNIKVVSTGYKRAFRNNKLDEFKTNLFNFVKTEHINKPIHFRQPLTEYYESLCAEVNEKYIIKDVYSLISYEGQICIHIIYYMLNIIHDYEQDYYNDVISLKNLSVLCNDFKIAYIKKSLEYHIDNERFGSDDESDESSDNESSDSSDN
jgi:hypothetical protein